MSYFLKSCWFALRASLSPKQRLPDESTPSFSSRNRQFDPFKSNWHNCQSVCYGKDVLRVWPLGVMLGLGIVVVSFGSEGNSSLVTTQVESHDL